MIQQMLAIWSLVPLSFLKPAWTSGSSQFTYCWSLAWRILSILLPACEMKAMIFPVVMYGCESWTVKKAEGRRIDAFELLEKTLESPLDCKEIQPIHPKGDQSWVFIGRRIDAETPVLWQPHVKSWLIGKDSDAGRDWGQEERGMTEDEMAGWHHWLDELKFE